MLDPQQSKLRQQRLLEKMAELKLDAIAVGLPHHVYYLSAFLPNWLHSAGFILFADGRSWLTTANAPAERAEADERVSFEAQWLATLRQEQPSVVAEQMHDALRARGAGRVGIDLSPVTAQLALLLKHPAESIDEVLW